MSTKCRNNTFCTTHKPVSFAEQVIHSDIWHSTFYLTHLGFRQSALLTSSPLFNLSAQHSTTSTSQTSSSAATKQNSSNNPASTSSGNRNSGTGSGSGSGGGDSDGKSPPQIYPWMKRVHLGQSKWIQFFLIFFQLYVSNVRISYPCFG